MKSLLQLITLALACAALSLFADFTFAEDWSGIRVYLGSPREAWSGTSECDPCNRFCADLRAYNRRLKAAGGTGWRIGYSETAADGRPNRIVLLRALDEEPTPTFVGVLRGVETDRRIEGYDPGVAARTLEAILRLDPIGTRTVVPANTTPHPIPQSHRVRRIAPHRYEPHWTWPGDLRQHLANTHGYPRAWLDGLSLDQLEALHDLDHDSGRVTPHGRQRWPANLPAIPVSPHRREQRTSGMQILGMPLYQQWRSRSSCPGGICP